jgi:copper chaperone CopZ
MRASHGHITVQVKGMHCEDCVRRVAEAILGVEGVEDAEVDLESGLAEIALNENEPASEAAIADAVREAGYESQRVADDAAPH